MNRGVGFRPCNQYELDAPYRERVTDGGTIVYVVTGSGVLTLKREGEGDEILPVEAGEKFIVNTLPDGRFSVQKL